MFVEPSASPASVFTGPAAFLRSLDRQHLAADCVPAASDSCIQWTGNILRLTVRIVIDLAAFDSCVQ